MEMSITRGNLRYERLAAKAQEELTIEGECALAGSMRDAVTVLSVQAQAHITQTQALEDKAGVKGRVSFQVLYTQGDLTRIRSIETTCDFVHELPMPGAAPGMRLEASAALAQTDGAAASGRMSLRALLEVSARAFEENEMSAVCAVEGAPALCARRQAVTTCIGQALGEGTAVIREEFDLADRLRTQGVLTALASAEVTDITGGNGKVGVSGVVHMTVYHQPDAPGEALVVTTHEAPFTVAIHVQATQDLRIAAQAQVLDVMADSAAGEKMRTLRVEAEVCVRLSGYRVEKTEVLEDLYSVEGPRLEPVIGEAQVIAGQAQSEARESVRIQAALPADAPPAETVLAAFANPVLSAISPAGRRLQAEGLMNVTLVYLPVDSDIPYAVRTREPFSMTFPLEAAGELFAQAATMECSIGPATSDRVELRCVIGLRVCQYALHCLRAVTDIAEYPEEKLEHGFVLVWPAPGESRWDTARRLRVPQEALNPAGTGALMAMRK